MSAYPNWLLPLVEAARMVGPDESPFPPPEDGSGRASAVLIAFAATDDGPGVLLIKRADTLRRHPGQVAFPGGAVDETDADHVATALREAEEEVGLDPASVQSVGRLPPIFIPPSGFVVTPVLAWWHDPHPVAPVDAREVDRVELVPISALVDPANRFTTIHPSGRVGPGFDVQGLFVWGFTGILLDRLLTLGGWNRPWDRTRERTVPQLRIGGKG